MSITQFFQCGYLPEPLNQNRYDICKWKKKKAAYKPPQTVDKVPVFAGTFTMSTVFLV